MPEKEYVDRGKIINGLELSIASWNRDCNSSAPIMANAYRDMLSRVKNYPVADVVEVVRCKDCKHFCPYEGEEHKGDCEELVGLESCVYEDDFCSYGERRCEE